jgi:hypothetical protein
MNVIRLDIIMGESNLVFFNLGVNLFDLAINCEKILIFVQF